MLITTHASPDGDAIGSLLAMGLALEGRNKKITLYNESPIPAVYTFLPRVHTVTRDLFSASSFDLAVVLDCGDLQRVGEAAAVISDIPEIINIDHHITNTRFGTSQFIDDNACASTEILWHLFTKMKIEITQEIATCIYTGILTDTGSFRFSNTNRASFEICEKMVACGVNPYHVARYVYGAYSLGRIKLLNLALDTIEISRNGKVSLMSLTRSMMNETNTQVEDTDGLINYARRIRDVKVAVLIQEKMNGIQSSSEKQSYQVSLRSDETVDVASIATSFGGGGHRSAAGFTIDSTLPEIKNRILKMIESI